mmetsp:Transcript_17825/g.40745  ORF Transcript_17825/g.40745 Transcript_17825/m.40745 type:complete len:249 (+) Transcript_17825:3-749(+)
MLIIPDGRCSSNIEFIRDNHSHIFCASLSRFLAWEEDRLKPGAIQRLSNNQPEWMHSTPALHSTGPLLRRPLGGHQAVGRTNAKLRTCHGSGPTRTSSTKTIARITATTKGSKELNRAIKVLAAIHKAVLLRLRLGKNRLRMQRDGRRSTKTGAHLFRTNDLQVLPSKKLQPINRMPQPRERQPKLQKILQTLNVLSSPKVRQHARRSKISIESSGRKKGHHFKMPKSLRCLLCPMGPCRSLYTGEFI